MKKLLKVLLLIVVIGFVLCIGGYAYYGGFSEIIIKTENQGGEIAVYKDVVGNYSQTPEITDEIYNVLLNDYSIETFKGFGTFYDNPEKVQDKNNMRFAAGCIIEPADTAKLSVLPDKYKIMTFPKQKYIVTEFSYKGFMSILVGIMKVYPALNKYYTENGIDNNSPITEIYDVPNNKITYRTNDTR